MWSSLPEAQRQDGLLPAFPSRAVAEKELFAQRDDGLRSLTERASRHHLALSHRPADLDTIEALYFDLFGAAVSWLGRRGRSAFEFEMGILFGVVAVAEGAKWTVYESPFVPGRYGLAVSRGNVEVVLNGFCSDWARRPNNKRRQLLRRMYGRFFGH